MLENVKYNVEGTSSDDEELERELLTLDVNKVNIGNIPKDFIGFMLSRGGKPGDFCISIGSGDYCIISILSEDQHPCHMTVEKFRGAYRARGLYNVNGKTIGELLFNILKSPNRPVFGARRCVIHPRRLLTFDFLQSFRIFGKSHLICKYFEREDGDFIYYRANLTMDDSYAEVILKNNRRMDEEQWKQHIFDELKATFLAEDLKLPVRPMLGVIIWRGGGYMVYSGAPGRYLQRFLQENMHTMNCWTKIKLCAALARVMSQLYNCDRYCGVVELDSFYINFLQADSCGRIQPVFAEGKDLTLLGEYVTVHNDHFTEIAREAERTRQISDFTRIAPEVELTHQLTPLTASYGMGQVLQAVLENGSKPSPEDMNYELAECVVEKVIKKCLNSTACRRPSVQEISTQLNVISKRLKCSRGERWNPI